MTNGTPGQDPDPTKQESTNEKFESLKKNEKIQGAYRYATNNTKDTIAYILMIIGLVLLFSQTFYGGLIIGLIFGFYFAREISSSFSTLNDLIEEEGMVRSLIFGGLLLGLLVLAPSIFIGTAVAVGVKNVLFPDDSLKP